MSARPIHVPLADVADACGVTAYDLINKHWPTEWAVPRDFRLVPRSSTVLVVESSLPQLAKELKAAGLTEAAERLLGWVAEFATPEPHEDFVARHTAKTAEPQGLWFRKGQYE